MIRWVNKRPIMPNLVSIFLFMGSTKVAIIGLEGVGDIALKLYYSFSRKLAITRTAMREKCFIDACRQQFL